MNETPEPLPPLPNAWLRPELVCSWGELVGMTALALIVPVMSSMFAALHGSSGKFAQLIATDRVLVRTMAWEATFLSFFLLYLSWRGWRPGDLRIRPGVIATLQGLALYVVGMIVTVCMLATTLGIGFALENGRETFPQFIAHISPHILPHSVHVSWISIVAAMVLNAFYEEITCMGYIFTQIAARRGPVVATVVTVFLRTACHTYQDPFHLIGIGVLFTLYALVYWYTRKLWPLIFAHIVLDVMSIGFIKNIYG